MMKHRKIISFTVSLFIAGAVVMASISPNSKM